MEINNNQSELPLKRRISKQHRRYKLLIAIAYIVLAVAILLLILSWYSRMPNIDDDTLQSICNIISMYDTTTEMIFERIRFVIIVIGIMLSRRRLLLFHTFLAYKMVSCELYVILRYIIDGYAGVVDCFKSIYPFGMVYVMLLFVLKSMFVDSTAYIMEKRKSIYKRQIATLMIFAIIMFLGLLLEIKFEN